MVVFFFFFFFGLADFFLTDFFLTVFFLGVFFDLAFFLVVLSAPLLVDLVLAVGFFFFFALALGFLVVLAPDSDVSAVAFFFLVFGFLVDFLSTLDVPVVAFFFFARGFLALFVFVLGVSAPDFAFFALVVGFFFFTFFTALLLPFPGLRRQKDLTLVPSDRVYDPTCEQLSLRVQADLLSPLHSLVCADAVSA